MFSYNKEVINCQIFSLLFPRKKLFLCQDHLASKVYYQNSLFYIFLQIQGPALRAITNLADSDEKAKNLIKCGVTPKNVTLITIFYQVSKIYF